jgi:hypothetical protein
LLRSSFPISSPEASDRIIVGEIHFKNKTGDGGLQSLHNALLFRLKKLSALLLERGIDCLVDGAHRSRTCSFEY